MNPIKIVPRLALAALVVGACSSHDTVYYHSINFGRARPEVVAAPIEANLGIEPFRAVTELGSLNLISRKGPELGRYQTYQITQLWAALPSRMADRAARNFFENRLLQVETYPGSYVADLILRAELTHFEEIRGGGAPVARVALRYQLLGREEPGPDDREFRYRPLTRGWRTAEAERPLSGGSSGMRDGSGLTSALGDAMEGVLEQVWEEIVRHRARLPREPGDFLGP
jgi:ABC-type uncharacterized transport system auxiliary subunit